MKLASKEKYLKKTEEKLAEARKYLDYLEDARNQAPSAMESRHDTSRETLEMEVAAQKEVIKGLKQFEEFLKGCQEMSQIKEGAEFSIEFSDSGEKMQGALYAPISVGLEGIRIITSKSPLGAALLGKTTGNSFSYQVGNSQISGKVEEIS